MLSLLHCLVRRSFWCRQRLGVLTIALVSGVLIGASPARAAQVVDLSLNETVRQADAIVLGTVTARRFRWGDSSGRWAVTDYTLTVEDVIQPPGNGDTVASTITVTYWGGTMDGRTQAISDVRLPAVGERLVLMLRADWNRTIGMTPVVGFNHGLFSVVNDAATGVPVVRDADGQPLALSGAGAVARRRAELTDAPGVSLAAFAAWLRSNIAAIKAAPAVRYPVPDPTDPRLMPLAAKVPESPGFRPAAVVGRNPVAALQAGLDAAVPIAGYAPPGPVAASVPLKQATPGWSTSHQAYLPIVVNNFPDSFTPWTPEDEYEMSRWNYYAGGVFNIYVTPTGTFGWPNGVFDLDGWPSSADMQYVYGMPWDPNTIGITIMQFDGGGWIVEADIALNPAFSFTLDDEWVYNGGPARSFRQVMGHELGHMHGLQHQNTYLSVMNDTQDVYRFFGMPFMDDAEGIRNEYPGSVVPRTDLGVALYRASGFKTYADATYPASVLAGGYLTVNDYTVENVGTTTIATPTIEWYLTSARNFASPYYYLGTSTYSSLAPFTYFTPSSVQQTFVVPANVPTGAYYLAGYVRNDGGPGQTGFPFSNNNAFSRLTIQVTAAPVAFGKTAPGSGATGQSTNPTLSWGASTGATDYQYCIDTTNDNACSLWTGTGTNTFVSLSSLAGSTTYYWQVRATNAAGTTYANGSSTAFWSFTTVGPDSFEPDGTAAQASLLVPQVPQPHTFHVNGDVDWAHFAVVTGQQYTVYTGNLGTGVDTVLYLYGTDGVTLLTSNDDSGGSLASRIVYTAAATGTYYVKVVQFSAGFGQGTYTLTLEPAPGTFGKSLPANGATGVSTSPTLSWGVAVRPDAAARPGAAPVAGETRAAAPIEVRASGIDEFTRTGVADGQQRQQGLVGASINVTYTGFTPQAQAAFQYAVNVWASQIASAVPIQVDATWTALGPGVLGSAGPSTVSRDFTGAPLAGVWYPAALANKFAGTDLTVGTSDINASFSSAFANWYFGTDGLTPAGQYDFVSVVLHELGHGLGFIGSASVSSGVGSWGIAGFPLVFDLPVVNGSVQSILNTGLFPNPSATLAAQLQSNNLFWDGTNGKAGNGGVRPKLYTPVTWQGGSSYSHLDESTYAAGNANSLMTPAIGSAEAIHTPGPITLGLFKDWGWVAPDANTYEYCYDTTNDNACSVWTSTGANTSVGLSGLANNTTYYWHVRATNGGGTTYADGSSTAFWSFTTQAAAPGAFGKSLPTNGATGQSTSPTLSWGASSGATGYEYCVDTTNDNACSAWTSTGTNTSVGLSSLTNNTPYYWHVRASNGGGTTYADGSSTAFWNFATAVVVDAYEPDDTSGQASTLTEGGPQSHTFHLTNDADWARIAVLAGGQYTITTANIDSAVHTSLYLYASDATTFLAFDSNAGAGSTIVYTAPSTGNLFVKVLLSPGSGTGRYTLTLAGPPALFSKVSPASGSTQQPFNLVLSWTAAAGATSYEYCFDTSGDNSCNLWTNTGTNTSVTPPVSQASTTYYWQVRANNASGTTYADGASLKGQAAPASRAAGPDPGRPGLSDGPRIDRPGEAQTLVGNMTYHNGPVQRAQKVYTIFWAPPGYSFPAGYQTAINQFVQDLNQSTYYAIASQYSDGTGSIGTALAFGGSWLDTSNPFPAAALGYAEIMTEVNAAKAVAGWTSDANSYFQVYTPPGISIAGGAYCGFHYGSNPAVGHVVFPTTLAACRLNANLFTFPNSQDIDSAINVSAHEILEAATDPLGTGWYFTNTAGEIADQCESTFFPVDYPFGNVRLNGRRYILQFQWSNAANGCVLMYGGGPYWTFTTGPAPGAFGKSLPANAATGLSSAPTLTWGASSGATSYEYCYDTTNNNSCTAWTSVGTNTSVALNGLSAGTAYYWHVRAKNPDGTTYSDGSSTVFWSFTTQVAAPGAFGKSLPTNGATAQSTSPTVSWGASTGATGYEYCVDTTNDNACSVWTSTGTNTSVGLSSLAYNTPYYWHVRASNGGGTTYADASSTAFWSFTTAGPPGTFGKSLPANGATGVSTSPTLSWGVAVRPANAARPGAAPVAGETRAAAPIEVRASGIDEFTRTGVADGRQRQQGLVGATINVTYTGFTPQAQAAFQYAVNVWASQIASAVPIQVDATWTALGPGVLGSAGPSTVSRDFTGAPLAGVWYPAALANKFAGTDLTVGTSDISASFSSAFANWYFGTDGLTPAGQYDFVSVVLHELGHGLGFIGSASVSGGVGSWGLSGFPLVYDLPVVNGSVQSVLNTGLFPNPSAALAAQLQSNNLFWDGTNGKAGNGGVRPKLYTPVTWQGGSSYSHLDESTYAAGNANSLMTPAIGSAEAIHAPGPITLGLFKDWGWVAPDASTYEYCLDTTNDNACTVWMSTGGTPSVPLSGLVAGTTYYWQVRATNASGTTYADGSPTAFWSFTTQVAAPGAFGKSLPTNGATAQSTSPTLSWGASAGATGYEYCIDMTNDSACGSVWTSTGTNTSVGLSNLLYNTTYYWHVRASNGGGTTYADASSTAFWSFTTQVAAPAAFNKSVPINGATGQVTSPTLVWGTASGATGYEYCYDTTNDNACSVWTSTGANTSVGLSSLGVGTTYYWQVRATNTGGTTYANGSTTAFWSFTTQVGPPGAFGKSLPANGATSQSTSPTLSWGAASGATGYEYCYDTSNDNLCGGWTSTGTNTSVGLSSLAYNTPYYWQVRATSAGGTTYAEGSTTAFWSFTTQLGPPPTVVTVAATSIVSTGATLNATINPNGSTTTVYFEYGTTLAYGSQIAAFPAPGSGVSAVATSGYPTDLTCNTPYHFRAVATNGTVVNGSDLTFTTSMCPAPGLVGAVRALTVDPTNPNLVYAGTSSGVYKTVNGGANWTRIDSGLPYTDVTALAVDPNAPCRIIAGIDSHLFNEPLVIKNTYAILAESTDCGANWGTPSGGQAGATVLSLAFTSANPAALFVDLVENSKSGGFDTTLNPVERIKWQPGPTTDLTYRFGINVVATDPAGPCTAYTGDRFGAVTVSTGCSGATTWSAVGAALSGAVKSIAVHPTNQSTLLAGTGDGQIYRKIDGVNPWVSVASGLGSINSIVYQPGSALVAYAAGDGGVLYKTTDGGGTWASASSIGAMVASLAMSPAATAYVYAGGNSFVVKTVQGGPPAFGKSLPVNGAAGQSTSPTLSWGATAGATGYEYCIDTTNDNACSAWTSTGTNTSVGLSSLANATPYYWHVRATNGGGTTYADGGPTAFWSFTTTLVQNGDFGNGAAGWATFGAPDASYMESTIVNGVYQWRRLPQTPGQPVSQATIYQPSGVALGAGVPVSATFDLGNTSSARKYMKVLLVGDANFTDLAACAFWLPPNAPLTTFAMRAHTTKAWTNATIYFYASSPNTDNGYYLLDNVSMAYGGAQAVDRTECVDPRVPAPPGGAAGPNLLTNGDFGTGVLAPFGTVGNVTTQISSNVLEFYRGAAFPPPVIQQATGQAMTANQLITATFQLGNSSPVRKRVLLLLNDNDFSDLTACTFWLEPGAALATYALTGYASKAWTNATLSIYPSTQYDAGTPANNPWIRMDNLTLQRTPSATTTGTTCLEPGAAGRADRVGASAQAAQGDAGGTAGAPEGAPLRQVAPDARAAGVPPARIVGDADAWVGDGFARVDGARVLDGGAVYEASVGAGDTAVLEHASRIDLRSQTRASLVFVSQSRGATGQVQVRIPDGPWAMVASTPGDDAQTVVVDLDAYVGAVIEVRLVFEGVSGADMADAVWRVSDLDVLVEP